MRAIVFAVLLSACGKDDPNAEVCGHYAKLFAECREDKSDAAELVEDTAKNMCSKGLSEKAGKNEQIFGAGYRAMIECTRAAKDCAAFQKCQDTDRP